MDLDELLNDILESFLLECVSNKVEDVSELPKMLKDISYLDDKQSLIDKTTRCEILDCENAPVEEYSLSENEIHIHYELDFILQTFIDSEYIWRVQGCAQAELSIPDANSVDWSVFDESDDGFCGQFKELYEKHKELVHFQSIVYTDIECDTL